MMNTRKPGIAHFHLLVFNARTLHSIARTPVVKNPEPRPSVGGSVTQRAKTVVSKIIMPAKAMKPPPIITYNTVAA